MDYLNVLTELCGAGAPSGFEGAAAEQAAARLAPLMDEVRVDRLGNVIGLRRGNCPGKAAKKLLLDAHLDEIGLLITGGDKGFLRFRTIGGVDPRMLPGREVTILIQPPTFGVVATLPPHLQAAGEEDKAVPMADLRIDAGLTQEEAQNLVGVPAVFRAPCVQLGARRISGKALDDRACFAILLRTAELLQGKELPCDLYILGSGTEETGGGGADTGVYAIAPDACVAVDVTFGDTPDSPRDKTMKLGEGPAVGYGPCMDRAMSARLSALAEKEGIPHQFEIMSSVSGTNGDVFQTAREGIPTAVLSLPQRYMHTPVEVVDTEDMEHTARLLAAFVLDWGKEGTSC